MDEHPTLPVLLTRYRRWVKGLRSIEGFDAAVQKIARDLVETMNRELDAAVAREPQLVARGMEYKLHEAHEKIIMGYLAELPAELDQARTDLDQTSPSGASWRLDSADARDVLEIKDLATKGNQYLPGGAHPWLAAAWAVIKVGEKVSEGVQAWRLRRERRRLLKSRFDELVQKYLSGFGDVLSRKVAEVYQRYVVQSLARLRYWT